MEDVVVTITLSSNVRTFKPISTNMAGANGNYLPAGFEVELVNEGKIERRDFDHRTQPFVRVAFDAVLEGHVEVLVLEDSIKADMPRNFSRA